MKKHYYVYLFSLLALLIVAPMAVRAEEGADDPSTPPPPAEVQGQVPPAPRPGMIVPKVIDVLRAKTANIQNNEDARNRLLELESRRQGSSTLPRPGIKALASTTRAERQDIRDDRREEVKNIREQGREDMRNASSGPERREIRKDMRKDEFAARKNALVKQLNVTLNNLKQIRERISSRIDKASSEGRDMTEAKKLLITADAKISAAELSVTAVLNFTPTASSTASTTIDLNKPRQIGETAIKALKDAHEALVAVVRAIAHAMGLGNATTTPPIIPPTSTSTATTTP